MIYIYCLERYTPESLSDEHVIPKALGGPLVLSKAACHSCNSGIANQWDGFLANTFPPTVMARAELDIRGHSGKQPEMGLKGIDPELGEVDFSLKAGPEGARITAKPDVKKVGEDLIAIALTEDQLVRMLMRKDVRFEKITNRGLVKATTFQTKEPVDWKRGHRAAAKILYCYLLLELGERILSSPPMGFLRNYFLSEDESGQIVPEVRDAGPCEVPPHHHVLMFDSADKSKNWVCLFRVFWFRFSLDLSALAPHGRMIGVNSIKKKLVEPITKWQGNWCPRTSISWGWSR